MLICKFYFMYRLKEVFTDLKMNIMTEASKLMSEDQFDVRKGPNLKIYVNMHLKVRIPLIGISICLTFFRHYFIRKHAKLCLNWILH